MSKFFINRPIFASVVSIIIVIAGLVASQVLPIAQYPQIAPPTVMITATYPGASAETLARTFAAPMYELSATKAERDAAAESARQRALIERLRTHLANHCDALKGMRVGDTRFLTIASGVPFGAYDVIANKRTFNVVVDATQTSVLRAA